MSDPLFYLRKFIKESIASSEADYCQKFNAHRGYYELDPKNPLPLKDVIDGWVKCGLKAYDPRGQSQGRLLSHVVFSPVQKSLNRQLAIVYTIRIQTV